jgi:Dolichyl-phosphate-mannose-protein mannosyltransferase
MAEDQVNAAVMPTPTAGVRTAPLWGLRLGTWAMGWDDVARAGLVASVLLVILTFRSYGLIWDEEWQAIYGHKILAWYTSFFTDDSAFTYLNLHFYGGAFDLLAALMNKVSPLGEYETRHLMGGLVGVLGLAGAWRLGQRMGGPRAGVLAAALLLLIPGFWGHAFFNPKDVPFAVAMLWTLVWAVRLVDQLPRPRATTVLAFGAVLGLALGTRIGGVLMLVYLGLILGAYLFLHLWQRGLLRAAQAGGSVALALLPALVLAYAVMVVVWPWALQAPLNPLRAFTTFAHFTWPGQCWLLENICRASICPGGICPASC